MDAATATPTAVADADAATATAAPVSVRVTIAPSAGTGYDIAIGSGLIGNPATWRGLPRAAQAVVVSNPVVDALHGTALRAALAPQFASVSTVLLPDGEAHKTWETLNAIHDHLLGRACDRRTVLFALGGGVVGDITGFAAATYMRGVPFVQVPTTLLAQVDSSVGGKTAVNHLRGKNMVGAFWQPLAVVCDLDTLATLPARELSAGLAEVIKYGPIADAAFLDWIDARLDALLTRDPGALAHAVRRSCEVKAAVVGDDEREESGRRAILNFGHTFGHAIEAGLGFGTWLHGEAVGCGMVLGAELSAELGLVDGAFARRLQAIIARAGLPTRAPDWPADRWLDLMRLDKKADNGAMRYVVIEAPGSAALRAVPDAVVRRVLARHGAA